MNNCVASSIRCVGSGLIYRNPQPHVRSVHAYFPSVTVLENGEILCTLVLGEAFEAANCRTHLARSLDDGETWQLEGPIYPGTKTCVTSDSARLSYFESGELVAFMMRHDRGKHPGEGLTNHETLGFAPTELLLLRSLDRGKSWSLPEALVPPLYSPSFELCSSITALSDGRWVLPTSTWHGWNDVSPPVSQMVALVSHDGGLSWPQYMSIMGDGKTPLIYWESKVLELADGRLLSTAWAYDRETKTDLPNQYALSDDGGATWSTPQSTDLLGQTLTPLLLPDGRILSVYRRMDEAGLWANLSMLDGDRWINESSEPLWGRHAPGLTATGESMSQNFNVLRFGAPCLMPLADGTVFVAFWCYEDCVSNIRWFKLKVD